MTALLYASIICNIALLVLAVALLRRLAQAEREKRATVTEYDPVNYPQHYTNHPSRVEAIQFTRLLPFSPGNAVKYVMRAPFKGHAAQDFDKAIWYLTDAAENGTSYNVTSDMENVILRVLAHEPDARVRDFLTTLYVPDNALYGHRTKTKTHFLAARGIVRNMRAGVEAPE